MRAELKKKNADTRRIAEEALRKKSFLSELVTNLQTKDETVRYNSSRALNLLSLEHPEVLYPEWDRIVALLESDHTYWILSAIPILANLTKVDTQNRFEKIFKIYYGLLDHRSVIPAAWVAEHSGTIAKAKPRLRNEIVNRLLNIDRTAHQTERKDLIKSGIIKSFDEFFGDIRQKRMVEQFVEIQLGSSSPKTRKAARAFLENRKREGMTTRNPRAIRKEGVLTQTRIFMDKARKPDAAGFSEALGPRAGFWEEIRSHIVREHGPVREEWKFYGAASGWTMKTLLKKRNLFFLAPLSDCFRMTFVFGDRAVDAIGKSDLPKEIIDTLLKAKKYVEGRGLPVEVRSSRQVEIVKKLIAFKIRY